MGSGIEDFFGQIPPGMIIIFCGSGILLIGVLVYGFWARARRRRIAAETPPASVASAARTEEAQPIMNTVNADMPSMDMDDDLPDLDVLSHSGEVADPVSPPVPPPLTPTMKYTAPSPTPSMDDDATTPPPAPARPAAAYRVMLNGGETADAVEVLTVLRDVADGSLIIQIGSQSFRHPAVGADADFMRRLNGALRDLNAGASAPTGSSPAPAPRPAAPPPAASSSGVGGANAEPSQPLSTPLMPTPPIPTATSTGTIPAAKPPLPGDLPKFRIEDQPPMTGRRNRGPKVEIPEINIGASIEAFLQHKRVQNGDFNGRHIHVRSGLGGAIVIEVDGQFYDAVGDVKDPAVRAYLQETIEEWQARQ